jgi:hypothetical protein
MRALGPFSRLTLACRVLSAALAFGTPAASEAGSMYGSMRGGSLFGSTRGYAAAQEAQEAAAPGGYSSYAAYTAAQRPSPAVQRAAGDSGRRKSEPGDFGHWLNESAISTATEKTPVPVSPAFPGDQRLAHVAEKTEEQMRRAVQADVAGTRVKACLVPPTCLSNLPKQHNTTNSLCTGSASKPDCVSIEHIKGAFCRYYCPVKTRVFKNEHPL